MTPSQTIERERRRLATLRTLCADDAVLREVLAYTEPAYELPGALAVEDLGRDEPHVSAWQDYAREACVDGAFQVLRRRFVQLRFPIRSGISTTDAYRGATLRGCFEEAEAFAPGLQALEEAAIELTVERTIAGRVPVIAVRNRQDFETIVRAFTERNEPVPVPGSMGACFVSGLINWNRIGLHRERWLAQGNALNEASWAEELRRLSADKRAYQDRCFILARTPYSAVDAHHVGMTSDEWQRYSFVIRLEHEATHYLTTRVFGRMRTHLFDELLADFAGLRRALGRYESATALRFLGLEAFPHIRESGRLRNYAAGTLSEAATQVVAALLVHAAKRLEHVGIPGGGSDPDMLARYTLALATLTLEEVATLDEAVGVAGFTTTKSAR